MHQQSILEKSTYMINEHLKDPKYKTELCKNYLKHKSCSYRVKCRYAHGEEELISKNFSNKNYKKMKCDKFYSVGYCPYGVRCQYLHEYRNLDSFKYSYYHKYLIEGDLNMDNKFNIKRLNCFEIITSSIDNSLKINLDRSTDKNGSLNTTISDDNIAQS